ncbi:MAG: hypothetical protein DLM50_03205 [Candidatus Meridianibacter frigidus]|nr:MAG: hypothetical protein DLM50_03205 [Candidatus Eremiobacteraeota bacterium]
MKTTNELFMQAPAQRIFALAGDTERWPEILPHYRYVRVLREEGEIRTVAMGAWRDMIPVAWIAEQRNDECTPAIDFRHVGGWTQGMQVRWQFEPQGGGTLVRIVHELDFKFPVAAKLLGRAVVGRFFVENIAEKTLRRIKELSERG